MNPKDYITEITVSASRKKQLERYEPIEAFASITAELPDDLTDEERDEFFEVLSDEAWEQAEQSLTERYEEHVRAEAFGDD